MANARPQMGAVCETGNAPVATAIRPADHISAFQSDHLLEIIARLQRIEHFVEPRHGPFVRLLPIDDVMAHVGLSRGRIYELIAAKQFPQATRIGRRALWLSDEVIEWVQQRRADRDAGRAFAPEAS